MYKGGSVTALFENPHLAKPWWGFSKKAVTERLLIHMCKASLF